jgi:hypothetical protein
MMRAYLRGWRRKAGCVMFVIVLALVAGWARSRSTADQLCFMSGWANLGSLHNSIRFVTVPNPEPELPPLHCACRASECAMDNPRMKWRFRICGFGIGDLPYDPLQLRPMGAEPHDPGTITWYIVPYWSLVLPLTVLSTLLLWPQREPKTVPESPPASV